MNLRLSLDSLLEGGIRHVQELLLLVILLLDVGVDVALLVLLVLDVSVKELIDSDLELLMIIDVVSCPEDSILEAIDVLIIGPDDVLALLDQGLDLLLSSTEVLNHESKVGVLLIVLLKLFVHLLGASFQIVDGHLPWSDVLVELLDLEIKHELELLELLGPLLETEDQLFLLGDDDVLLGDVLSLVLPGLLELFDCLALVLKLGILVLHLSVKGLNFTRDFGQLVLSSL